MNRRLNFLTLNAQSLRNIERRAKLIEIVKDQKWPHFLLLQETNIDEKHNLRLPNYNIIRTDANAIGTAIAVINYTKFQTIYIKLKRIICTAIVATVNGKSLLVCSLYNPAKGSLIDLRSDLKILFETASKYHGSIMGGDFNAYHADWHNDCSNKEGLTIANFINNNYFDRLTILAPFAPTRYESKYIIDFFIVSQTLLNRDVAGCPYELDLLHSFSDHFVVQLSLVLGTKINLLPLIPKQHINYKKVDWSKFDTLAKNEFASIELPTDKNLDNSEINNFLEKIQCTISNIINKIKSSNKPSVNFLNNLPEILNKLITERKVLKKKLNQIYHRYLSRDNIAYKEIKSCIREYDKLIRVHISIHRKKCLEKVIKAIDGNSSCFQKINRLTGRKKQKGPTKIKHNDQIYKNEKDIAEVLAVHFYSNFIDRGMVSPLENSVKHTINLINNNKDVITNFNNTNMASQPNDSDLFTDECEVFETISTLNNKKSEDSNGFSNKIIKKLSAHLASPLCIVLNNCINNSYFPDIWKLSRYIAVPKKGDRSNPENYRPIALIPILSKILEKILKNKIDKFCSDKEIIPPNQFGFEKGLSTHHPLIKLTAEAAFAAENHLYTACAFLDVQKAFDAVWIEGLVHKMYETFKFPTQMCKIILSYLLNRRFFVNVGDEKSLSHKIATGVPQGSILGPLLYKIFIADIPSNVTEAEIILYADDTAITAKSSCPLMATKKIESVIKEIKSYYDKWKVSINKSKTQFMVFTPNCKHRRKTSFTKLQQCNLNIDDCIIERTQHCKYLGVLLSSNLKFDKHVEEKVDMARKSFGAISFIASNASLNKKVKLLLYKQIVRPVITYAFPIWFSISKKSIARIALFERRTLRTLLREHYYQRLNKGKVGKLSNAQLYEIAGMPTITEFLMKLAGNFMAQIGGCSNKLIESLQFLSNRDLLQSHYQTPLLLADQSYMEQKRREFAIIENVYSRD